MTDPTTCSRCGAPLPAVGGECPRCLLRLGLELPPRDPAPAPTAPTARGTPATPADASRRPVALPLAEVARRFPQLEIKALIGQGGMGVVYHARQPRLGRDVALKLLPPEQSSDPAFAERFLREARAMARLAHPNIVAVHDFGESDGLCWLLMDFVDGVNLRQALATGALAPEKALAIVPQMCDALQYAHDEGVVHRDIKPENVLLDRQGRVKIADFGLAKLVGPQDVTLTGDQQVFGTPHYMAPEQMEAAGDVDHRADIFSLGVVFYEMLTGRLPIGRFEPPSRRVAVDVRLDDVVLHALEHEPERRYQHAAEVKTDVESVVAGREPEGANAAAAAPPRRAGDGRDAAEPRAASADVGPRRRVLQRLSATWLGIAMILWPMWAWRLAGEMATHGWAGVAAGLALLAATAWIFVMIFVSAVPALRDALASEPARVRALRAALGWPALVAGLLLLGMEQVEGWERGTLHYSSEARSPRAIFAPAPAETAALLQQLDPGAAASFERESSSASYNEGRKHLSSGQAYALGLLLLVVFVAASVVGAPGRPAWRACAAALLLVPLLLLAGLRLAAAWSDVTEQAEEWPSLVPVSGTARLDLGVDAAGTALRQALERERYAAHADQSARLMTPAGAERAQELVLAAEPIAPWDRWDLEDGLPRRRRPHVTLHFVGDAHRSVLAWSCGSVRPLAAEPAAWREWLEQLLRQAGGTPAPTSGG